MNYRKPFALSQRTGKAALAANVFHTTVGLPPAEDLARHGLPTPPDSVARLGDGKRLSFLLERYLHPLDFAAKPTADRQHRE